MNRRKLIYIPVLLITALLWNSCNVINPVEQVPTYVHIDSFNFVAAPGYPVTTHSITQVWAYYNGTSIGTFDLPATIPVIATGSGTLTLDPGIVVDGLNNLTSTYPFYELDTSTLVAQPGKVINYQPHTRFFSSVNDSDIGIKDSQAFFQIWADGGSVPAPGQATMTATSGLTYNGSPVGVINLTPALDSTILEGTVPLIISYTDGEPKYIEIDYKCTVPFELGLQATFAGIPSTPYFLAGIYPSATWQKFYLAVADFAGQYKADSYNLFIRTNLPPDSTEGHVYLANIQLLRFFP